MKLHDLCDDVAAEVDGCLGCAVVDLNTGLPLAMRVVPGTMLTDAAMEVMAAASVDYFRGRTIWQMVIAMADGASQPGSVVGFVREIQTTTEHTYHFMSVVPGREDALLILVIDKTANLGLGWIAMRQALARLRELGGTEQALDAIGVAAGPHAYDQNLQQPVAERAHLRAVSGAGAPELGADAFAPMVQGQPEESPTQQATGMDMANPRWRGGRGVRGRSTR